ncbi:MAG: MBL fold metallo-hydrolase [Saprospiraceae bacterium]
MVFNKKLLITFLGTGTSQGIPVIGCTCKVCISANPKDQRLRTSVLVETTDRAIVIDCGPDFRQQLLRAGLNDLHAILLTHEHNDHIVGLDDVRPFNFKYWRDMPVYATQRVQDQLKKRFSYIFSENPYPGSPMVKLMTIAPENNFEVEGIPITPIEVRHGGLPVLGFRIGGFTYLTDVKTISATEKEKAKNSKVLVLNALHHQEHHSHLNLNQALDLIAELEPDQAYLTHLSHTMGLHVEVSKLLPPNVAIAFDGLQVEV